MGNFTGGKPDLGGIVDDLSCGMLCCRNDVDLTIAYASQCFYRMLRYEKNEITALLSHRPASILRNDPPVNWREIRAEIEENGYACPELRLIKKDGHHIWASYRVTLQIDENGEEYFCGLVEEITLKRRARRLAKEQAEELEALTANVPGGVLRCRADEFLTLDLVGEGFCRITGFTRKEISERFQNRFLNMVYEKDREPLLRQIESRIRQKAATELTYRVIGKNRRTIWVLDKSRRRVDCNGQVWLYSVLIDITEMKQAQDELAVSEERYRLILEHAADPVLDCDLSEKRFYFSPAFQTKFGDHFPLSGDLWSILSVPGFIFEQDAEKMTGYGKRLLAGVKADDEECRFRDAAGNYIWCNVHTAVFFDQQGAVVRLILVISDIDRRKKEALILRQKAEHDLLTGLYNRVTTTKMVENAIAQSVNGERHALFVVDIDNFKNVNDRLGHLCGDQLIVETASEIKRQFREEDVIGRIGGDEFVVFLKNINSFDLVVKKAEILRRMFRESGNFAAQQCNISGSIGISLYPYDGASYDELFRKADAAMYAAKNCGKDSYRIYTSEIGCSSYRLGRP